MGNSWSMKHKNPDKKHYRQQNTRKTRDFASHDAPRRNMRWPTASMAGTRGGGETEYGA